ncbi:hypothetical protein BLS_000326 [Venturia inaequalis]|uniref:[histone H3]-trimethyl-L-lysine(9) demethylase n=2 Tax=Venturia inaequalis TaxID=5025 RepID=A0A8H3V0E1_VENIN|nr:hypothetical protein BLS_000326 [Venturia inaequalis]RDI87682.1 hypothetical protein Vi05172_g2270 [Venturia inaequalis]
MGTVASPPHTAEEIQSDAMREHAKELPRLADDSHRILTPPTSEDHDGNSSELSDIEDEEEEDIGEITPDHYWDEENGGKIPVFKPTMDQFRSFKKFVEKINDYGMKSGIVKIIPPQEWRDSLPPLDEAVKTIKVKNPITQEWAGTHGVYTGANIEKQRSYNLPQWRNLCEETNHRPPPKKGERRAPPPSRTKAASRTTAASASAADGEKRKPGRPRKNPLRKLKEEDEPMESTEDYNAQVPPTPTSPDRAGSEVKEEATPVRPKAKGRQPRGRQPKAAKDVKKSTSSRRVNNRYEGADEIDEEAFQDFDYHLENVEEFNKERCAELEENYWKTINFGTPMYGADMPGSLFDKRTKEWNVANLDNLLDVLGQKVPGVNTAYLYLGMWKASFAWHLEDVDLYSINYIHFGAPKQWYSISQADARKFEQAMRTIFPQDYKHCDQFLRHKTYLISPEKLKSQFGIKVNKLVHYEGEFVITYPYGYHSGYNIGYNCAESVNFATHDWLQYGRIAKKCDCESDSVWVDVNEIERKLRGEPTPEYVEVTDDDDSEGEVEVAPAPAPGKAKAGRKRKRPAKESKVEPKRKVKRLKLRVRMSGREPCVLCPNDVRFDYLLPTDTGKQAHKLCALYTPETYIVVDKDTGAEKICGVGNVDKARLDLKCNYCRSKKGSCFQCSSKKCTRAFHATCAAAAGVLIDHGPTPTWDEDGTEYYCDGFDFRCKFHRPRRPKTADTDYLEKLDHVKRYAKGLKKGDLVQALCFQGDIFAGMVAENRPSEGMVLLDIQPEIFGVQIEIEWKYLLVLDPVQSLRPKPSPLAKPLPEHLSNNDNVNSENRKDGVPEVGDSFHDPETVFKWAEWNSANVLEAHNPLPLKVDFKKPDQLWHYLPKTSTEARPQYTDDHSKLVHNMKSNFLDTVKPPVPPTVFPPQRFSYGPSYSSPSAIQGGARPVQQHNSQQPNIYRPYNYKPKDPSQTNVYAQPFPYQNQNQNQNQGYQDLRYGAPYAPMHKPPAGSPNYPVYTGPKRIQTAPSAPYSTHSQSQPAPPNPHTPQSLATHFPTSRLDNSPPIPNYYQEVEQRYSKSQALPAAATCTSMPSLNPSYQSRGVAPIANMLAPSPSIARAPATPPIGFTPPSLRSPSTALSTKEYVGHIQKYPYLVNVFTRRPREYISPYASGGGFGEVYQAKLDTARTQLDDLRKLSGSSFPSQLPLVASKTPAYSRPQASPKSESAPTGTHYGVPPQPPRSHMMQYQSQQDFERHVSREKVQSEEPAGGAKWGQLLHRLRQPDALNNPPRPLSHSPAHNGNQGYTTPYAASPSQYSAAPASVYSATTTTNHSAVPPTFSTAPGTYPPPTSSQPYAPMSYSSHPRYDPPYQTMAPYSTPPPQQQMYNLPPPSTMVRTSSGGGFSSGYRSQSPVRPDYSPLSEHATPRPVANMHPRTESPMGRPPQGVGIGLGLENYKI